MVLWAFSFSPVGLLIDESYALLTLVLRSGLVLAISVSDHRIRHRVESSISLQETSGDTHLCFRCALGPQTHIAGSAAITEGASQTSKGFRGFVGSAAWTTKESFGGTTADLNKLSDLLLT